MDSFTLSTVPVHKPAVWFTDSVAELFFGSVLTMHTMATDKLNLTAYRHTNPRNAVEARIHRCEQKHGTRTSSSSENKPILWLRIDLNILDQLKMKCHNIHILHNNTEKTV